MKIIRQILKVILIATCVVGIPTGNKIMNMSPDLYKDTPMTRFEAIVAVPGIIACCIIGVAVVVLVTGSIMAFFIWLLKIERYE